MENKFKKIALTGLTALVMAGCENKIEIQSYLLDINNDGQQDIYFEIYKGNKIAQREIFISNMIDSKVIYSKSEVESDSELYKEIKRFTNASKSD